MGDTTHSGDVKKILRIAGDGLDAEPKVEPAVKAARLACGPNCLLGWGVVSLGETATRAVVACAHDMMGATPETGQDVQCPTGVNLARDMIEAAGLTIAD